MMAFSIEFANPWWFALLPVPYLIHRRYGAQLDNEPLSLATPNKSKSSKKLTVS